MKTKESAAVVGAGPCGVAAAIQLQRCGIPTFLFESRAVGGLLHNANLVENYPGIPGGIPGPGLCRLLQRHLQTAGINPIIDRVREIIPRGGGYTLRTESDRGFQAKAVVIATGTRPRTGILPGEETLAGRRIFYEVRDVSNRQGWRHAAILGAGDAAHDYALNLASRGFKVSLLQRSPPRCLPLLSDRVAQSPEISVMKDVTVTGCREVSDTLEIQLIEGAESPVLNADLLLIACGRLPADDLLQPLKQGEDGLMEGIYTGGDLVRGMFRQAGIAVGDGLRAAMALAGRLARDHQRIATDAESKRRC